MKLIGLHQLNKGITYINFDLVEGMCEDTVQKWDSHTKTTHKVTQIFTTKWTFEVTETMEEILEIIKQWKKY